MSHVVEQSYIPILEISDEDLLIGDTNDPGRERLTQGNSGRQLCKHEPQNRYFVQTNILCGGYTTQRYEKKKKKWFPLTNS